jgi:hypothetical protein
MNVKAVAGDKTFNWSRDNYKKVFEKKWFDIIGGEMPYVEQSSSSEDLI